MGYQHILKEYMDFKYSVQPFLLVNQKPSVTSWFSGVFTIILCVLCALICVPDIVEVWKQKNPSVYWEDQKDYITPGQINLKDLGLMWGVVDAQGQVLLDPSIYGLTVSTISMDTSEGEGGYTYLNIEKCKDNNYYCLSEKQPVPWEKLHIGGIDGTDLEVYMKECTTPGICKNQTVISNKLSSFVLYTFFNSTKTDVYERTFTPEALHISQPGGYVQYSYSRLYFKKLYMNYTTPFDVFSPGDDEKSIEGHVLEDSEARQTQRGNVNNPLASVYLTINYEKQVYYLSYDSIPSVFGSVYGLLEMVWMFGEFILGTLLGYFENSYYFYLINSFFHNVSKDEKRRRSYVAVNFNQTTQNSATVGGGQSAGGTPNTPTPGEQDKNATPPGDENLISNESLDEKKEEFTINRKNRLSESIFSCCIVTGSFKENNKLYLQGKKIVQNFIDVVFIMRKLFEFEQLTRVTAENRCMEPYLIDNSLLEQQREVPEIYQEWFKYQSNKSYRRKASHELSSINSYE